MYRVFLLFLLYPCLCDLSSSPLEGTCSAPPCEESGEGTCSAPPSNEGSGDETAVGAGEAADERCGCGSLKREHSESGEIVTEDNHESASGESTSLPQDGMILIPGGVFTMGTAHPIIPLDGEGPVRQVSIPPFYLDKYEVSNAQFAKFIAATGHVTDAQRFGDSFVLDGLLSPEEDAKIQNVVQGAPWWLPVRGATWDHPEGQDTNVEERANHPVVHVSWSDARAYCTWAGMRLPSEAQFERACHGGREGSLYPWGDGETDGGVHQTNIWQGVFPGENTEEDGYKTSAPVGTYPSNDYGVHDMIGNVWEWVEDWWTTNHSPDGSPPKTGQEKVKKGGSFMCTKQYCYRYRCQARTKTSTDTTGLNVGFRCAKDV